MQRTSACVVILKRPVPVDRLVVGSSLCFGLPVHLRHAILMEWPTYVTLMVVKLPWKCQFMEYKECHCANVLVSSIDYVCVGLLVLPPRRLYSSLPI